MADHLSFADLLSLTKGLAWRDATSVQHLDLTIYEAASSTGLKARVSRLDQLYVRYEIVARLHDTCLAVYWEESLERVGEERQEYSGGDATPTFEREIETQGRIVALFREAAATHVRAKQESATQYELTRDEELARELGASAEATKLIRTRHPSIATSRPDAAKEPRPVIDYWARSGLGRESSRRVGCMPVLLVCTIGIVVAGWKLVH